MKSVRLWVAAAVVLAGTSGCYRSNIVYNHDVIGGDPDIALYSHNLIAGAVNVSGPVDASSVCENGVARVQTKYNGITAVATMFTGWLYTPLRVRVWCNPVDSVSELIPVESEVVVDAGLRGEIASAVQNGQYAVENGELVVQLD